MHHDDDDDYEGEEEEVEEEENLRGGEIQKEVKITTDHFFQIHVSFMLYGDSLTVRETTGSKPSWLLSLRFP
jgi:hypothetical protein